MELISAFIGLILTLMVFSYLIGDNPLFRFAIYLFIGVSSGYAVTVIVRSVFLPRFQAINPGDITQIVFLGIPLLLCVTLLAKVSPRASSFGNLAMGILVGVGAAAAIGGALIGTLLPQAQAAMDAFNRGSLGGGREALVKLADGVVMFLGTVFTLASFQFGASKAADGTVKRNPIFEGIAWVGRIFIAITLGVIFAGVYMAALTAMIERLNSFILFAQKFFGS
jgi:hypothetical protein